MIVKMISPQEREAHRLIIEKINPLIRNNNFEVDSYSINPAYGNIEIILDHLISEKRVVFTISTGKEIEVWAYNKTMDPKANTYFSVKTKNIPSSKRITDIIQWAQ